MKKLFFFLAAMALAITANAKVINGTPNPGEDGLLDWWVNGADQAGAGDTIVLADGEYLQGWSMDFKDEGLVIMAAEGAKPVIKASAYLKIHATTTFIGITFDGMNTGEHGLVFRGTDAKNLILKDCEIKNYPKCLVYCDNGYHVDSLIIDNCLLHDAGRVAVYVATSTLEGNVHGCDYFEMTNSTVYNINSTDYGAGAIDIRSNNNASGMQNEILIDHVTLYNCQSTGDYGIIASYKSGNVKISNSIAANPEVFGNYSFRVYEGVEVANCLYYNASPKSGASYTGMIENQDPLFLNPAAGDFNLQPGSPAIGAATDGTNLGDPRWKVAAAELAFAMAAPAADVEATDLYTIKWTVLDPDGDATIKLEYKAEEGDWTTIAENIPSTKSAYDWNIRKMPAQTVAIRGTLANATKSIVSEAAGKLTIVPEAVAPRPVRELTGLVEESALTLTWINPDQPFSTTTAIETLEQAVADGTAELTYSEDNKEVTAAYTTEAAWVQAGLKLPMNLEYVNSLTCQLKRDAADGTQIMITIEQNGYDWWYLIETGITTEWTDFSFTEFKKLGWHNESDATVLDGTNVTAIYISTNDGSPRTGSVSLRNLVVTGNAPAVADYEKTIVCVSEEAYPTTIVAEEVVYEGTASTWTEEIDPTKDLYVSVFAQDDLGNTSVAAQYKYTAPEVEEPTYDMEITCTNLKTVSEGNMTHFLGTSADGMEIDLIVFGFNGAGTYEGVEGSIYADGTILFTGTAEYATSAVEGTETNVLTAELALANGMTVKLTMYNLNAGDTDEPSTPGETITVEMYDATFTVEDGELAVEAENDDHAIVLWLSDWNGYGDYEAYSVWGFVDDVEVANLNEGASVEKEGLVATLYVVLTDGTNTYNVIVSGMAPAEAGGDDEPVEPNDTITITANNLTADVPYAGYLLLKANANDADDTQIILWLVEGDTKGYGEYGYTEYPSGLWPDVENASYGDVNLTLSKEVPAKYYQDGTVNVFEGTFLGDDNNLYILVLRSEAPTVGLENLDTTVAPAKAIVNGQLVIIKNGVQYNAQGAVVK